MQRKFIQGVLEQPTDIDHCLYPAWAGVQDKFSFTKKDKNFPLKRLRAKRAPRERVIFFLSEGKLILLDRPCRMAIPNSL